MSVFGNIMSSIFGHAKAQTTPAAPGKTSSPASSSARSTTSGPRPPVLVARRRVRRPRARAAQNPLLHQARRSLRSMSQPYSPSSPTRTRRSSIGESQSSI